MYCMYIKKESIAITFTINKIYCTQYYSLRLFIYKIITFVFVQLIV